MEKGASRRRPSRGRPKGPAESARRSSSAPAARPRWEPKVQEPEAKPRRRAASTGRTARRPRPTPTRKMDWGHPQGKKFEELKVDSKVDGVVVNTGDYGVFADIGFEQNVILAIPRRFWRRFRRGDVLEDLQVLSVDLKLRRASVTLQDVEQALIAGRVPLEELQEGNYLNGVVDTKNQYGIFVNIGVDRCHGRLQLPRAIGSRLLRGQVVRDLCIATVDVERKRVRLIVDDVEAAIEDPEMVSLRAMTSDPESSDPKVDPASHPAPPTSKDAEKPKEKLKEKPKEEVREQHLEVGELVDGIVVAINAKGVWVDIGGPQRGLLEVSAELKSEFQRGDSVQGMRVEEVTAEGMPILSMDNPELEV
ncbi:unnamed protein product [Effrenium voratum]|uniref:S1 motif domain-containing protein n=1 Tax=Effrenium voratum TaxID=2562239 RepID=A0AA36JIZ1_9DINO|nr:unnamed protein product [Effrenium voratum]CAJ1405868.1 unnamed protein product [Effrenium voratum]CAJ1448157.1 unnamed protein product [Effrenium voratum]